MEVKVRSSRPPRRKNAQGFQVVGAVAAQEGGVGDDAVPAGADDGRARERARQRGEAEEDLGEEVLVANRGSRRRLRTSARAAGRKGCSLLGPRSQGNWPTSK
ncbi:hypothetical protein BS78_05G031000 [Paspalum vaginatum]|nr:hypothetical protein BS78_05G031000 [Paspalum vaginatum]